MSQLGLNKDLELCPLAESDSSLHLRPIRKSVQVSLDGIIPCLPCVDGLTELGVSSKCAEGALDPTVQIANKDVEQHRLQ
ncbi:hypothetical protein DUI87_13085 [Hirundo rustica rustica]|uniref:Uncharacterized protein n=1 Tax=Hirundo rustica rustica TaxID=333673 RepID=A0A3M0KAQ4_HIRRU|nr:hypothetical protein DUI87_13085 [Hirundo rustica rustica]